MRSSSGKGLLTTCSTPTQQQRTDTHNTSTLDLWSTTAVVAKLQAGLQLKPPYSLSARYLHQHSLHQPLPALGPTHHPDWTSIRTIHP
jgi:hypothetical protein